MAYCLLSNDLNTCILTSWSASFISCALYIGWINLNIWMAYYNNACGIADTYICITCWQYVGVCLSNLNISLHTGENRLKVSLRQLSVGLSDLKQSWLVNCWYGFGSFCLPSVLWLSILKGPWNKLNKLFERVGFNLELSSKTKQEHNSHVDKYLSNEIYHIYLVDPSYAGMRSSSNGLYG